LTRPAGPDKMPPMITVLNLISSVALASALLPRPPAPQADTADVWVERRTYLMGTVLEAGIEAPSRAAGVAVLEEVFGEIRRLEGVLSSWTPESEIGRLNAAAPCEAVEVTLELWELLREAADWSERTGGAFDPAVGALVDAWDLRGDGRVPDAEALAAALRSSGMARYRVASDGPEVSRLRADAWLDTGGFGKGTALRAAATVLHARGIDVAYLDFGGQVLALGSPAGESAGWEIGVAHPTRRQETVTAIRLHAGSVATSSQSERFVEMDGRRFGHVLDPRTGMPVTGGASVTVVAGDPLVADILATALLVMGPEEGGRWAAERDDVGVLFLVEEGDAVVRSSNAAFARYRNDQTQPREDGSG
jgi:thiamine biosynthesis lipoprotein